MESSKQNDISNVTPEITIDTTDESARKWGMKAVEVVTLTENGDVVHEKALRRLRWTGQFSF